MQCNVHWCRGRSNLVTERLAITDWVASRQVELAVDRTTQAPGHHLTADVPILKRDRPEHLPTSSGVQVRTERSVLPEDHPQRVAARLDRAIASVEAGRLEEASVTLAGLMEDEERSLHAVNRLISASASRLCAPQPTRVSKERQLPCQPLKAGGPILLRR